MTFTSRYRASLRTRRLKLDLPEGHDLLAEPLSNLIYLLISMSSTHAPNNATRIETIIPTASQ